MNDTLLADTRVDTFMCVHSRDVDTLLGLSLAAFRRNFACDGRLILVTNDVAHLRGFLARSEGMPQAEVVDERAWLSGREVALPGWYKQQIIKLRSHRFCSTEAFCALGADTLLLRPITRADLFDGAKPALYYTPHRLPSPHLWMEFRRVHHVARILGMAPGRARRYIDFINDFFCFDREWLAALDAWLVARHGPDPFVALLSELDPKRDQHKFGEWTLYSCFLLDCLRVPLSPRPTRPGYLTQVHSNLSLRLYRFDTKIAHIVPKHLNAHALSRIARYIQTDTPGTAPTDLPRSLGAVSTRPPAMSASRGA